MEIRTGQTDAARTRLLSLRADAMARGYLTKAAQAFRAAGHGSRQSRVVPVANGHRREELATLIH